MSGHPRYVLSDTTVVWDGVSTFVRKGPIADVAPGSALETAYGGPSNLSGIINAAGDPEDADHAAQGN
jgi:hypothetical protein